MKDNDQVIQEFNDIVNMTASELKSWLESNQSTEAGWSKDDEGGETVGHESGRKIVKILESNPKKDAQQYTDDQIEHMRKVVAYCKRHLAQEKSSLENKSESEAKKTKSYISLKNWGHDPLKKSENGHTDNKGDKNGEKDKEEVEAGNKRSSPDSHRESSPNRSKVRKGNDSQKIDSTEDDAAENKDKKNGVDQNGKGNQNGKSHENGQGADNKKDKQEDDQDDDEKDGKGHDAGRNSENGVKPGDKVSWEWGNGQPTGKVLDVKEKKATITTKNGNKVSRDGSRDDPAVVLDTGKSKAIKSSHELLET